MYQVKSRWAGGGLMLLFALLCCALASCGATPSQSGAPPNEPAPTVTVPIDLPITISFAGNFSRERLAALDELIAQYESENPDVRIEVVRAPKDPIRRRDYIASRLSAADNSLDMFLLDATWPAPLASGGGLQSLDEHLAAMGLDTDLFLPGLIQSNVLEGRLMALPWVADGGLLYYRIDLLDQLGRRPPETWEQLEQIALEIRDKENLPHGYVWQGIAAEDLTCSTLEHVWSEGGDLIDASGNVVFDSEQSRTALSKMNGLVASGASPNSVADYDDVAAVAAFRDGEAVFMRDWFTVWDTLNSDESPVAGRVGIASLPATCLGGQSLALSSHSLHPEEALRFMAYLAGYDQQVHLALNANQPPVLASIYEDAYVLESAPLLQSLGSALSGARGRPSLSEYDLLSEAVYSEVNRMLSGEQDASATANSIQRRAEFILR